MSGVRDFMRASQNGDGGWGYKPGGISFIEPTAAAILALSSDAAAVKEVQRARLFLKSAQRPDGGWGIAAPDDESGWMTAWAVWSLADSAPEVARNGAAWLLKTAGIRSSDATEIQGARRVLNIDAAITGWPWHSGDAAWVFPTALALLALRAVNAGSTPRAAEGVQYLLDRAIPTGGWNIGNPFMVTGNLPPTVECTVLALMALRALGIENATTSHGEQWLAQDAFTPTAFEWAWRAWYWKATDARFERARQALSKLQMSNGSFDNNPFTTALAAMSLIP